MRVAQMLEETFTRAFWRVMPCVWAPLLLEPRVEEGVTRMGFWGGMVFGIGLWELVGFWLVFCFGELLLLGNWLVFHQRGRLEIPWLRILFSTEVMVCGLKRVHLHLTLSLTDVTQASCPIYLMYLTGIGT